MKSALGPRDGRGGGFRREGSEGGSVLREPGRRLEET